MSAALVTAGTPLPARLSGADDRAVPPRVAPGGAWRDSHEVLAARDGTGGRWFRARNLVTGAEEWLRVSGPALAGRRQQVWQQLAALDCPRLQQAMACHDEAERVEIWSDPGAITLHQWRTGRATVKAAEVTALVRDLAEALAELHRRGVGHFAIRPDNIMVADGGEGAPSFRLAGFDAAELFEGTGLVPIPVDPGYAPPEAAGLFQHSPGPLLAAWDYWSLGRVVQEFILGHGVLELLPDAVRTRLPPSLAGQAESLLSERETGSLRAGAVELMTDLGRRETRLLRGLLTGAREGRWGAVELADWLAGGDPVEHYDAPRHRRFFRLAGRGLTVAEAAILLAGPEHHTGAVAQVFAPEQPGTLAAFLEEARGHQPEQEQMLSCRKLVELPALGPFPPELRREVAAAVCLHALGRGAFRWRGHELDARAICAAFAAPGGFARVSRELRLLSLPLILEFMRKHDGQTADLLERLRGQVEGAEQVLVRHGWAADRPQDVWLAALATPAVLRERTAALHRRFARSTHKALDAIFQAPHPTEVMQILLAWADGAPERYGFRTHEQVRQEELGHLAAMGHALLQALFWHRLRRALGAVPLVFGSRWLASVGAVAVVAALAVHVPGPSGVLLGLGPVLFMVGLRVGLNRWQARLVRTWTESVWGWGDGPARCGAELRVIGERAGVPGPEQAVRSALRKTEERRAALLQPGEGPGAFRWPPRHFATWAGALLLWLMLFVIGTGSVWRAVRVPPDLAGHRASWQAAFGDDPADAEPPDPRMSWPYRTPLKPDLLLATKDVFTATSGQEEQALVRGRQLVANYRPDTITHLVAVYVTVDARQGGLLLYDGAKDKVVGKKGPVLNFVPMPRSWLSLEDQLVVFIDK